jgi:3-mercaptopyruvate sulfurtransferase SseA
MTTAPEPATRDAVLADPGWLEAHLHDPSVRVVEVDVSRRAHDEWHIDGAVLWNVYADLKDAEYRGERFWPSGGMEPGGRAGRVPSAVHQPIDGLYDDRGAFRPGTDLRSVFPAADGAAAAKAADAADAADPDRPGELITYCTIGGRASTAWFVLTYLLGRENVRVYDGSWAEWGRMTGTPVERS